MPRTGGISATTCARGGEVAEHSRDCLGVLLILEQHDDGALRIDQRASCIASRTFAAPDPQHT